MAIEVHDVPDEKHFAAVVDGEVAGKAVYIRTPELIVFTHTEVFPAFEGRGVGSALARAGLDQAREWGLPVLPLCPFISGWIGRHREYVDVVYSAPRTTAVD
ncbi:MULTISPECIES: GNAT family N-acetyltransferase [Saccharothrix]|uniref:GNAT family N-acetyltransferase n=1 Tax=Saccharothrix yanglingensis TaxID=659496 RepID=A0ABU0WZ05_9PSEU|nr:MULTISPECIES: GNAT family N-acetyltransferase [Saccharothrix]MBY8850881.1 N-acetyltransferase [Saccharothrix sp. MB29]MDQ2585103.1 GNAT family N-acetyltransferase [Saccharothrix yanglingensis]MDU0294043.1 GNAT family N-acetyltransferase [Saccharothrix longispora]